MAPISSEEQVKFLLSCIKFSEGGKIDFAKVAKDCGIVTAGAAAKRYSRLSKSTDTNRKGDATAGGDQEDPGAVDSPKKPAMPKRKTSAAPKGSGKKPKVTKDDAVMAAESLVETRLEPTKDETDADLYLFGNDAHSE